jgi:hypothetical protein
MNFLNLISILSLLKIVPLVLGLFILNSFLQETSVRKKFLSFLFLFTLFLILGIYFNLDGIILLFIVSELAVLLIFIIMFSQLTSFSTQTLKKKSFFIILFFSLLNFTLYDIDIISYKSFYNQQVYQLNDFFYFFNYFFEKQTIVTIVVIMLITLYSLFFIMLYFSIRQLKLKESNTKSKIFTLRKQNIIKQSNYTVKTRFFQK